MVKGTIGPREREEGEAPGASYQQQSQPPRGRYLDYERSGWTELRDSNGRRIGIAKLTALEEYDLGEAMGSESARIERNVNMATIAAHARAIDDDLIPFPRTRTSLRALIQQLDTPGINAIATWMMETLRLEAPGGQSADPERSLDLETAKN